MDELRARDHHRMLGAHQSDFASDGLGGLRVVASDDEKFSGISIFCPSEIHGSGFAALGRVVILDYAGPDKKQPPVF